MFSAPQQLSQVERAKKALGLREKGCWRSEGPGTHIQVVGENHGRGAIAEGESLGELASISPEPGHVHAALLQAFSDRGHLLEEDPGPERRKKKEELCTPP